MLLSLNTSDAPLPKSDAPLLKARESNKNQKYSDLRDREYLLESEVTPMMKAAKSGRWGIVTQR